MQLLAADWRTQNEFLFAVSIGVFECEHLQLSDFTRIAQLNTKYADLPGDESGFGFDCNFGAIGYCRDRYFR